jgi:DNA-binding LytR/AlgR family response regulator
MQKYKCLIADDNKIERNALEMYLQKIEDIEIKAVCKNGLEAREKIMSEDFDIVFSDIDMPELSGLSLLKSLSKSPVFIFISSHPEYAVESYSLDVIDFILKPISFERLLRSVNKATEYIELRKNNAEAPAGAQGIREDYFFIKESNDLIKLHFADVAYIESMGDFSKIYTINDKRHITLVNLKNLEGQLPSSIFTRIHKQYMVNHEHISSISNDEVIVNGKFRLPVSQSYRQMLLDKIVNKKIVTRHITKEQ